MMFKLKFVSLVLLLMIPSMLSAVQFKYNYRGIVFTCIAKEGKAKIVAFDKDASKVFIPSTVVDKAGHNYPVYMVDLFDEALLYQTTDLVLDKGIIEIAPYCFYRFVNLNIVYIPSSIEKIGKRAFYPKHMPQFKIPSNIKESDLKSGLAIYPKQQMNDIFNDVNLAEYDKDYAQATNGEEATNGESDAQSAPKGIAAGTSDVDFEIPMSGMQRENTFCVIIANEKYESPQASKVDYAAIDGATFKRYCINTLGIPEENIRLATNAKYFTMQELFEWIPKVAGVYGNDANFIVYYAGHGVPGDDGTCYLLPVDANPQKTSNGYSLKKLYDMLGGLNTKSALVLIDACFSGNGRDEASILGGDRGIVRNIKSESVSGNVVVMSAASNIETALPYEEKGHGLFTYYVLKKLQESKGKVKYGELYEYVRKQVSRRSVVTKSKAQTPNVAFSKKLTNWNDLSF